MRLLLAAAAAAALAVGACSTVTGAGGAPTPSATTVTTPSAMTSAPSASPTAAPSASPTVDPTIDPIAGRQTIERYMAALAGGDYPAAWALLAPGSRKWWHDEAGFAYERHAFMAGPSHGKYTIGPLTGDRAKILEWVNPQDADGPPVDASLLARVDFPDIANSTAGFDMLVVAPGPDGSLLVWTVR